MNLFWVFIDCHLTDRERTSHCSGAIGQGRERALGRTEDLAPAPIDLFILES